MKIRALINFVVHSKENIREKKAKMIGIGSDKFHPITKAPLI